MRLARRPGEAGCCAARGALRVAVAARVRGRASLFGRPLPAWHRGESALGPVRQAGTARLAPASRRRAIPRRAPCPSRVCFATVLPLPRPRHKPLKERAVYQALALSAGSAMAAARTTFATVGAGREMEAPPPPPAQPVIQPVAAEVPAVSSLETERKRGGRELEEGRGRRDRERIAEEEEEGAREAAPKVHSFVLAYTLLLALTALGLTIAGGATNYWVSVRLPHAQRTAAMPQSRAAAATTRCDAPFLCCLIRLLLTRHLVRCFAAALRRAGRRVPLLPRRLLAQLRRQRLPVHQADAGAPLPEQRAGLLLPHHDHRHRRLRRAAHGGCARHQAPPRGALKGSGPHLPLRRPVRRHRNVVLRRQDQRHGA